MLFPEDEGSQNNLSFLLSLDKKNSKETLNLIEDFKNEVSDQFSEKDGETIIKTLKLVLWLHKDQEERVDGSYVNHPIGVALKMMELLSEKEVIDVDIIIAALLHDTVEDQSANLLKINEIEIDGDESSQDKALAIIENEYGKAVSFYVKSVTSPDIESILEKEGIFWGDSDFHNRKNQIYLDHILENIIDPIVCLIKFADFSFNGMNLKKVSDSPQKREWCLKYRPVVDVFINRLNSTTQPPIPISESQKSEMILELEESARYIDTLRNT